MLLMISSKWSLNAFHPSLLLPPLIPNPTCPNSKSVSMYPPSFPLLRSLTTQDFPELGLLYVSNLLLVLTFLSLKLLMLLSRLSFLWPTCISMASSVMLILISLTKIFWKTLMLATSKL
uniref:Uncharacterized protein n=1 Tax=Cacopsylla melanoneura TaxID=428564 RepID=A0A8D8VJW9_9HEMI